MENKNILIWKDAYEWFIDFKQRCEDEGIADIDKIPQLIREAKKQNERYKELKIKLKEAETEANILAEKNWNDGFRFGAKSKNSKVLEGEK